MWLWRAGAEVSTAARITAAGVLEVYCQLLEAQGPWILLVQHLLELQRQHQPIMQLQLVVVAV
jgi:hypothetical protein